MKGKDELEAFQSLFEDAADDVFVHATGPSITHDVCCATLAHETESDVELVAVHPRATDTEDVGMFGERHEGGLAFEKAERVGWKGVEVEDFEGTGSRGRTGSIWRGRLGMVEGSVDDGGCS